jgi:hypothetical protein
MPFLSGIIIYLEIIILDMHSPDPGNIRILDEINKKSMLDKL